MFPELKKYSILPESKGTITSFNTIPMSQELVDENNYPLFEGVINLAKEKQQQPMKTALQDLKEEIQSKVFPPTYNDGNLTDYQYGHNVAYGVVLTIVEYLLEKEKKQIIEAFDSARNIQDSDEISITYDWVSSENYYNETYNQNK